MEIAEKEKTNNTIDGISINYEEDGLLMIYPVAESANKYLVYSKSHTTDNPPPQFNIKGY